VICLWPAAARPAGVTYMEGPGIELTPSTVLHTAAITELGYDSNPAFVDGGTGAGYLRLTLRADWASRPPQRLLGPGTPARKAIDFRLSLSGSRLQYVTSDAQAVSSWELDESGRLDINPQGTLGASVTALYGRTLLPKNYEPVGSYMRDTVGTSVVLALRPRHSRMSFTLGYEFMEDWFESSRLDYAGSERHTARLGVRRELYYRLSATLDVSVGHISHPNVADPLAKADSTPLAVTLGVTGTIRPRLTGTLKLGYINGFYDTQANLQRANLSAPTVEASATWQVIPQTGRLSLGYGLQAADALMGDYYIDNLVYLRYDQIFPVPRFKSILVSLAPSYRNRSYHGEPVGFAGRDDDILDVRLSVDLPLKDWLFMGCGYTMSADFTGFRDPAGIPYGYVKHTVFVRAQAAY
jgi:hypothetical protein